MKHTPWYKLKHNATITESTGTTFRYVAICGHERDIALIPVCDDQETADEIACLITAAPDMKEVLLEMAFWFRAIEVNTIMERISPPGTHKAIVQAYKAAIAKGETP